MADGDKDGKRRVSRPVALAVAAGLAVGGGAGVAGGMAAASSGNNATVAASSGQPASHTVPVVIETDDGHSVTIHPSPDRIARSIVDTINGINQNDDLGTGLTSLNIPTPLSPNVVADVLAGTANINWPLILSNSNTFALNNSIEVVADLQGNDYIDSNLKPEALAQIMTAAGNAEITGPFTLVIPSSLGDIALKIDLPGKYANYTIKASVVGGSQEEGLQSQLDAWVDKLESQISTLQASSADYPFYTSSGTPHTVKDTVGFLRSAWIDTGGEGGAVTFQQSGQSFSAQEWIDIFQDLYDHPVTTANPFFYDGEDRIPDQIR